MYDFIGRLFGLPTRQEEFDEGYRIGQSLIADHGAIGENQIKSNAELAKTYKCENNYDRGMDKALEDHYAKKEAS